MNYLRFVKIIGTMHVSPESAREVRRYILELRPTAVAVELDPDRYFSLLSGRRRTIQDVKSKADVIGYLLAKIEEKAGEAFGMSPGGEMLTAVDTARELNIPVYFVDEHVSNIMTKLSREIPTREKVLLAVDSLISLLGMGSDYEVDFLSAMHEFKVRYPIFYRVLVEERDKIIARNLVKIIEGLISQGLKKPLVLAVLGWGHKKGVERLLNSWPSLRL